MLAKIINPVPRDLLVKEITQCAKLIFSTHKTIQKIYSFNGKNCPYLLKEITRLREVTFRNSGAGTGKEVDIDEGDTMKNPYQNLILWDEEKQEIMGGYRYLPLKNYSQLETIHNIATRSLYEFSEKFIKDYIPHAIDLGRAFIPPDYQKKKNSQGVFILDNLWKGIGELIKIHQIKYLLGRIVLFKTDPYIRGLIIYYLNKYFLCTERLAFPHNPQILSFEENEKYKKILNNNDYHLDYKKLNNIAKEKKIIIPPLIYLYVKLSPTLKFFGVAVDEAFGGVEELCIMVTVADIYNIKTKRYIKKNLKKN